MRHHQSEEEDRVDAHRGHHRDRGEENEEALLEDVVGTGRAQPLVEELNPVGAVQVGRPCALEGCVLPCARRGPNVEEERPRVREHDPLLEHVTVALGVVGAQ
eukprot:7370222-Prymnesium_polylepis.1